LGERSKHQLAHVRYQWNYGKTNKIKILETSYFFLECSSSYIIRSTHKVSKKSAVEIYEKFKFRTIVADISNSKRKGRKEEGRGEMGGRGER
jgi:hypothetical protein